MGKASMERKALIKAQSRLRNAQVAVEQLAASNSSDEYYDAWSTFIHNAKGIYTVLQQGAKINPKSNQWFGTKNSFRRNDELLRYVSEARNDDEHGIEPIMEQKPDEMLVGVNEPGASRTFRDAYGNTVSGAGGAAYRFVGPNSDREAIRWQIRPTDGLPVKSVFHPAGVYLKAVHDRSKVRYEPPKKHRGLDLKSGTPLEVASLTLTYLKELVEEAEKLA